MIRQDFSKEILVDDGLTTKGFSIKENVIHITCLYLVLEILVSDSLTNRSFFLCDSLRVRVFSLILHRILAMSRRGRPPKVKAVPRKPSMSCCSHESLSPNRYQFQSSLSNAPDPVGEPSNRVGLSSVTVLKSTPTSVQVGESKLGTGNPSTVSLSQTPVLSKPPSATGNVLSNIPA